MKPLPESITTALAAFSTGGAVAKEERGLRGARDVVSMWERDLRVASAGPNVTIQTWIRRRWNRRDPNGSPRVRVTTSTDHRDNTSVPLVIVETSGYNLDRLTCAWSGHSAEPLDAWIDRVATAAAALSVRPTSIPKEK